MSSNDHDGQSLILYTVQCVFTGDPSVADDWVGWLREEHLQDVMAAGANSAELLRMDGDQLTYEVRYRFPSREAFDVYERDHAPGLRDEGLSRFPVELGLSYRRSVGELLDARSGSASE